MSKITEYASLIIKGAPHTKQILEGIMNKVEMKFGTLPEEQRVEIMRRRVICVECPFMSKNAETSKEYKELTGKNYKVFRRAEHCAFCGCGIEMRTSSLTSDCGIETWNKEHPGKEISLKWTKFNTDGKDEQNQESAPGSSD